MDARIVRAAILAAAALSLGAGHRTPNFIVNASSPEVAQQVGQAAEKFRRELALEWLGSEMPNWSQPCPIVVEAAPHLGAGGATSFVFDRGEVFGWQMTIQGSLERILDSVLPHEVTHTIFATHFRQPLPRWADEGGCSTVEHTSERLKQQKMLIRFLQSGRGIPFAQMFVMREYPRDILPLYAQGHSLATFLIAQGGKQKYLQFIADGLQDEQWARVTGDHYGFTSLGALQSAWLAWVRRGSPLPLDPSVASPDTLAQAPRAPRRPDNPGVERAAAADNSVAESAIAEPPMAAALVAVTRPSQSTATQGKLASYVRPAQWQSAGIRRMVEAGQNIPVGRASALNADLDDRADEPTDLGALAATPARATQVTRPPNVEQSRQMILEWQHQPAPAAVATPVAATERKSVYEGRGGATTIRR